MSSDLSATSWSAAFLNDGGPMVVLPRRLLPLWTGAEGTDYDRACEAAHPGQLLEVGDGHALAFGAEEHVFPVHWLWTPGLWTPAALIVLGLYFADDEGDDGLLEAIAAVPCERLEGRVTAPSGELVLLHGASTGREVELADSFTVDEVEIGDALPVEVLPGDYAVEAGELDDARFGGMIFRFTRVTPGQPDHT